MTLREYGLAIRSTLCADDGPVLSATSLPPPPSELSSSTLVVQRGSHDYGAYRVDALTWFVEPDDCTALGLLILAQQLHQSYVEIVLQNPASSVTRIVVHMQEEPAMGLILRSTEFRYQVSTTERHPWREIEVSRHDLPFFSLTNSSGCVITEEDRAGRNVVRGFGSAIGAALFAELLLNRGAPTNITTEVALESDAGYRGVAPASAETSLWLPGSLRWSVGGPEL